MKAKNGFTLIKLPVVIGVPAGIFVPSIGAAPGSEDHHGAKARNAAYLDGSVKSCPTADDANGR